MFGCKAIHNICIGLLLLLHVPFMCYPVIIYGYNQATHIQHVMKREKYKSAEDSVTTLLL